MGLYGEELARVHADAFGALAAAASRAVVARMRAAGPGRPRVVDVGCGAGVSTRVFVDAGWEATGIEPSPAFLALAKARVPDATFVLGSAYEVELPPCDVVVAFGEVLSYHAPDAPAEALVQGFIAKATRALGAGGLLVFDLVDAVGPSLAAKGWRSEADWVLLHETAETGRRLTRTIETFVRDGDVYRRAREVHHVALFDRETVRGWLAGFEVEVAEAYGSQPLLPRRFAILAEKRGQP